MIATGPVQGTGKKREKKKKKKKEKRRGEKHRRHGCRILDLTSKTASDS
jgi:hypothetical protein